VHYLSVKTPLTNSDLMVVTANHHYHRSCIILNVPLPPSRKVITTSIYGRFKQYSIIRSSHGIIKMLSLSSGTTISYKYLQKSGNTGNKLRIDVDIRHVDDCGNYGYHRRLRGGGESNGRKLTATLTSNPQHIFGLISHWFKHEMGYDIRML
jgi:hypothetical protein